MAVPYIADCVLELRQGTGQTDASGFCSVWADQSGNGNDVASGPGFRPVINADGSLTFDGTNDRLTATFTLVQPITVYWYGKVFSPFVNIDSVYDGATINTMKLTTEKEDTEYANELLMYAGDFGSFNTEFALDTDVLHTAVWNGASSVSIINDGTDFGGNPGTGAPGGITLGASGTPANWSNSTFYDIVVYNTAHDAATQLRVKDVIRGTKRSLPQTVLLACRDHLGSSNYDSLHKALRAYYSVGTGGVGSLVDLEREWLVVQGATNSKSTRDMWGEFLESYHGADLPYQDAMLEYWRTV